MTRENCTENYRQEAWLWYHYGELDPADRQRQTAHLGTCPACRERPDSTGAASAVVQSTGAIRLRPVICARTTPPPRG